MLTQDKQQNRKSSQIKRLNYRVPKGENISKKVQSMTYKRGMERDYTMGKKQELTRMRKRVIEIEQRPGRIPK